MKKIALVIFTLSLQAAAGVLAVTALFAWLAAGSSGSFTAEPLLEAAALAALPLAALGLLASLFHLGNPRRAYRALSNLRSSWLSREILTALLFAGLAALFTLLQWAQVGTPTLRLATVGAAACLGLVLIYCMARVYRLGAVQAWDVWTTPLGFFATAFLLGGLTLGAALSSREMSAGLEWEVFQPALRWIGYTALTCLALQTLAVVFWAAEVTRGEAYLPGPAGSPSFLRSLGLRQILLLGCAAALVLLLSAPAGGGGPGFRILVWLALGLALAGEGYGRALFYRSRRAGRIEP